jgi:SsrA-binding protein
MTEASAPARVVAQNRKARHDYAIADRFEVGIVLKGSEVKSLRAGNANIADAFAEARGGDLYLMNAYIAEYPGAARFQHEPRRPRRLLLHRRELERLIGKVERESMTLVPLLLYFNARGIAKIELALARGRRKYEKREAIKEREWRREKGRLIRQDQR